MVINSKEFSARAKLGIMLYTLAVLAALTLSIVFDILSDYLRYLVFSAVLLLIIGFTFYLMKKYYYIYYNSDGFKIILRYSSLIPFFEENFSIEIPRKDFIRAELVKKYGGFRKELIIYVDSPQGVAKFKPVSLSTLKKSDIKNLLENINSIND